VQGGVGGLRGISVATLLGSKKPEEAASGSRAVENRSCVGSDLPCSGGRTVRESSVERQFIRFPTSRTDAFVLSLKLECQRQDLLPTGPSRCAKLTAGDPWARMNDSSTISAWLSGSTWFSTIGSNRSRSVSGAPALGGAGWESASQPRQAGIAKTSKKSVLSGSIELHEVKRALEQSGGSMRPCRFRGSRVWVVWVRLRRRKPSWR